jgi:hypothetical protein
VQVGENTGNMDEAFLQLSEYLERERETRVAVKSAMRYPMFVVSAIAIAMLIINIWVIPTFTKVFAGFGAELPLPTRILVGVSDFFVTAWPVMLAALIVAVFAAKKYVATEQGRYNWDRSSEVSCCVPCWQDSVAPFPCRYVPVCLWYRASTWWPGQWTTVMSARTSTICASVSSGVTR